MGAIENQSEWNEALDRVLRYLDSIGIKNREQQLHIALKIVSLTRQRGQKIEPPHAAMNALFTNADEWFGRAFTLSPTPLVTARGVAAFQVGHVNSSTFPFDKPVTNLVTTPVMRVPDLTVSNMTSEDIDFGAMEAVANETWHKFAWGPVLRAAAIWTAIFFGSLALYERFLSQ